MTGFVVFNKLVKETIRLTSSKKKTEATEKKTNPKAEKQETPEKPEKPEQEKPDQQQEKPDQQQEKPDQQQQPEDPNKTTAPSPPQPSVPNDSEVLDRLREEEVRVHNARSGGGEVREGELQRQRRVHLERTGGVEA